MNKLFVILTTLGLSGCVLDDFSYVTPYNSYYTTSCQTVDYGYMTVDCNGATYYKNTGAYVSTTYRKNSYGEVYTTNPDGSWSRNRSLE